MVAERRPVLLVVDDEPQMCRLLERFGAKLGYRVVSCNGGREAIQSLATTRADAALIDLQMPEIGGLDVLRAVRETYADCQVILMTAHVTIETARDAAKLGARDCVSKPLPFDRLGELLGGLRQPWGLGPGA